MCEETELHIKFYAWMASGSIFNAGVNTLKIIGSIKFQNIEIIRLVKKLAGKKDNREEVKSTLNN